MMNPRLTARNLGIRERIRVEKAAMAPLVVMTDLTTTQVQNTIRTTFIRRVCIVGDACRYAERILSFVSLVSTVLNAGYRFHIVMVLRQAALNV